MENKKIYNDDVERIVNDPERLEAINAFHNKRKAKRQRKMFTDGLILAFIAVVIGLLGIYGLLAVWVSFPAFSVCGLCSAFMFGRFFENGKTCGWA